MNFSGVSSRSIVGHLLRLPLRLIPTDMVLPVLQGELRGSKWIAGSSNHGCWLGSYEYEKQRLISGMIAPGTTVFDLGAHVGFYTLLFSRLVGSGGKVVAFEPFPPNLRYLRRHLALNRITNVEVIEAAVSETMGTTSFQTGKTSSMGQIAETGEFSVELVKKKTIAWPRMETATHLMVLGSARPLIEALQHATSEMQRWLIADHGLSERAAAALMGQALEYDIANVVDPNFTVVAQMQKSLLPRR